MLEVVKQRWAIVPQHVGGFVHDVITAQGGEGYIGDPLNVELAHKFGVIGRDALVHAPVVIHQIHFVDGHHQMGNAQEGGEEAVPFGLGEYPFAGIYEDDGQLGRGSARNHVAGVLNVPRRVGNDEFALGGAEIAVGDINGDFLLALGA